MLKRALFASAVLIIPTFSMQGAVTPAGAAQFNVKPKISVAPRPRIRVVRPKVRIRINRRRLARGKNKTQETATNARQTTVPAQTGSSSPRRTQDLTNLPPLPLRRPQIAALDAGKAGRWAEINDAADAWQMIRELEEMGRYDKFGQERGPGPGDDNGLTVNGLPDDLPEGSKPFEPEAVDTAAYFNQGVPQPGASGNPPEGGGPSPGPTGQRPGSGHVDQSTRQDVSDTRGLASDGDVFNEDGSGTRTVANDDGSETVTGYDSNGNKTREVTHEDGIVRRTTDYWSDGNHDYEYRRAFNSNSETSFNVLVRDGVVWSVVRKPFQPGVEPTPQELMENQTYLCATMPWACRSVASATPDEMLGQPDDPGNEGGARGTAAVARLGQDAVTNTGDSSFDADTSETPRGYGRGPTGGVLGGGCPNCTTDQ